MSSILKALKKLEQEAAENAGTPLTSGVKGRPKRRPKRQPGSLVVPGLIAFTLCIISGVGILIYAQNTSVSESHAVLEKDEKPVPAEKIPVKRISAPKTAAAIDSRKQPNTATATSEFEFATADTSIAEKQLLDVQKMPDAQPSRIAPGILPDIPPEMDILTNSPGFEYATASTKPVEPFSSIMPDTRKNAFTDKPVVKKTEPTVALIKDPSFELQAISWSADPDKRMAIINGKICREKDHVGGYMIQAIKSDEVILTKGAVRGKLVFEIR